MCRLLVVRVVLAVPVALVVPVDLAVLVCLAVPMKRLSVVFAILVHLLPGIPTADLVDPVAPKFLVGLVDPALVPAIPVVLLVRPCSHVCLSTDARLLSR